ncbi:MAG: hypothetical protein J6M56_05350 [Clostridia bacterium]|nr:hypothetical protein [Clostridia bacterium]
MSIRILPVALLICAAAVGFCSVCLIAQERYFTSHAVKTKARVAEISPLGERGQLVPIVSFEDAEGNLIKKRAQRIGALGVETGDEVEILYTKKKVFGLDAWNIFIVKNPDSNPYFLYTIMAIICGAAAMVLAVAGILIWIH